MMRPPAPLKARWTLPRFLVGAFRISHVFFCARIKSNQGFFTTSTTFVEFRRALLWPASLFSHPGMKLPLLPGAPLPPLLPRLPGTPPPPLRAFRCAFANNARFLKQLMQNFARVEAASFVHPGVLHADRASS